VVVRACVAHPLCLNRDDTAITGGAPFRTKLKRMPLMVVSERLFAAPDEFHRTTQTHHGQCQHNLDRHILTATKSAANRRINNPHLIFWQVQRMCNLPQVFMHPLPGDADGNPPLFVDITETSFWLKKCMFLITGTI